MKNPKATKGVALLKAFLKKNKLSQADASRALDVSGVVVCLWCSGKQRPRTEYRDALEIWTSGAVPASSWESAEDREAVSHVKPFTKPNSAA